MQYLSGISSLIFAASMVWLRLRKQGNNLWLWTMFTAGVLFFMGIGQLGLAIIKTISHGSLF